MNKRILMPSLLAVAVLAGCAQLPPADQKPTLAQAGSTDFVTLPNGQWPAADWWKGLNDPQLETLIQQALKQSATVEVVQAHLREAEAESGVADANRGVSLSANGSLARDHFSENSFYPPPIGGKDYWDGELSLNFAYDLDFWGRNRAALNAALGRETASRAEAAGAAASLSSAVASAYVHWQALNARVAVQQAVADSQQKLVGLEVQRVKAGLSAPGALHPLHAEAEVPHDTLVQLQAQRDQALYRLRTLVGGGADFPDLKPVPLPELNGGIPDNVSLDLMARRADVAAARDRVQAAQYDVDASRAAFYPDVSISALAGFSSLDIGKLLHADSRQLGVTPAVHLPIFDAGRLRAQLNVSRAQANVAVAEYQETVQNAVGEVNDAAVRVQAANAEKDTLEKQRQARAHDLDDARRMQKAGLADGRTVVRDELALAALDDQDVLRRERALVAHIDLITALGGGFQTNLQANNK